MDTSKLEKQFAELRESNQQLAEAVRVKDAEILVLRGHVDMLTGEVIKSRQDSEYVEQAIDTFTPNGFALPSVNTG